MGQGAGLPSSLPPTTALRHLDLRPVRWSLCGGLHAVREYIPDVLSHRVCGDLLQQPQETHTAGERVY